MPLTISSPVGTLKDKGTKRRDADGSYNKGDTNYKRTLTFRIPNGESKEMRDAQLERDKEEAKQAIEEFDRAKEGAEKRGEEGPEGERPKMPPNTSSSQVWIKHVLTGTLRIGMYTAAGGTIWEDTLRINVTEYFRSKPGSDATQVVTDTHEFSAANLLAQSDSDFKDREFCRWVLNLTGTVTVGTIRFDQGKSGGLGRNTGWMLSESKISAQSKDTTRNVVTPITGPGGGVVEGTVTERHPEDLDQFSSAEGTKKIVDSADFTFVPLEFDEDGSTVNRTYTYTARADSCGRDGWILTDAEITTWNPQAQGPLRNWNTRGQEVAMRSVGPRNQRAAVVHAGTITIFPTPADVPVVLVPEVVDTVATGTLEHDLTDYVGTVEPGMPQPHDIWLDYLSNRWRDFFEGRHQHTGGVVTEDESTEHFDTEGGQDATFDEYGRRIDREALPRF